MKLKKLLSCIFLIFALPLAILPVAAETIAVIGTGSVGGALGPRFASLGHQVIYGSRSPGSAEVQDLVARTQGEAFATSQPEAAQQAEVILLAVPWNVAEQVLVSLGDLSGKIIIDPINPRVVVDGGYVDYPSFISNAERMQALAPRAKVVKAFSSISADTMIDPGLVEHPLTLPIVGNDAEAKAFVAEMCRELGYETIDFGPVHYAHIIEGMYLLRTNGRLNDDYFEWNYPASKRPR